MTTFERLRRQQFRPGVVHGETGFLVRPGDVAALARALQRLSDDPELRKSMGAAARRRAEDRFDLAPFRDAHLRLYREELLRRSGEHMAQRTRTA